MEYDIFDIEVNGETYSVEFHSRLNVVSFYKDGDEFYSFFSNEKELFGFDRPTQIWVLKVVIQSYISGMKEGEKWGGSLAKANIRRALGI